MYSNTKQAMSSQENKGIVNIDMKQAKASFKGNGQ